MLLRSLYLGRAIAFASGRGGGSTLFHSTTASARRTSLTSRRSKSTQIAASFEQHDPSSQQDRQQKQELLVVNRQPIVAYPQTLTSRRTVPSHIVRPPYADSGVVPYSEQDHDTIYLHDDESAAQMRAAAQLAATVLRRVCDLASTSTSTSSGGLTTDDVDQAVHDMICKAGAYPSPLNYAGFPKSVCTSINEIICHGIPDARPLQYGDVVSFDVSCFLDGVHGDNCATIIVGDYQEDDDGSTKGHPVNCDWRGVPYRTSFATDACEQHFVQARRLVQATRDALMAAICTIQPGSCLSDIGAACQDVADRHGYSSVTKYRGHGISSVFHTAPFVKHYRNDDVLQLQPGMIFTIEPMLCQYGASCEEWQSDQWTVSTLDGGLAAQFEHTVLVTDSGVEILTIPSL